METKRSLGGAEKFAYGIGAVGKDMVYMLSATYVLYYFQDIMGVSAWVMGVILLAARVFDAFNDPIMGVIVAKTKTKWGKFRPWLLIGTITNAIVLYCMFACPPSLDGKGLVAYAAISYILWGVTYTMMDIPYWSMVPAFTNTGKERENLSALARSCAGVGSALITVITMLTVTALGNFFVGKNADLTTVNVNDNVATTIVMEDADGNSTSNVIELSDGSQVNVELQGKDKMFNAKDGVYLTQDSATTTLKIDGKELTSDDNALKVSYAIDDINSKGTNTGDSVLAIYVNEDTFKTLSANSSVDLKLVSNNEIERVGFKWFTLIIAVLFIVFITITCVTIKEKSTVEMDSPGIGTMFKALVQNDQAMVIVVAIVLINTATYITSNLLIYFFKYDLGGVGWKADYTLFTTFGGGIQILSMMILFPLLRKAFNTLKIFYISVWAAIVGYVVLLVMAISGVTSVYMFFVPGFLIFAAIGLLNVIVTVFLANTVDYGELKNNRRDESVIFSMQTFVVKLASGIAALVASITLSVFNIAEESDTIEGSKVDYLANSLADIKSGFIATIDNSSVLGLRFVMSLVPIVVLIIGLIVFKAKFKLTDEKLDEINAELAQRHAAEAAE